jgi:hypothetical protein
MQPKNILHSQRHRELVVTLLARMSEQLTAVDILERTLNALDQGPPGQRTLARVVDVLPAEMRSPYQALVQAFGDLYFIPPDTQAVLMDMDRADLVERLASEPGLLLDLDEDERRMVLGRLAGQAGAASKQHQGRGGDE